MKTIALILIALVATFAVACNIESTEAIRDLPRRVGVIDPSNAGANPWRRTTNGWELASHWSKPRSSAHAIPNTDFGVVHPGLIAILQLLLSLGALALFRSHTMSSDRRPSSI